MNVCACLAIIILLAKISQVLSIPYLELLSDRYDQWGGEQVEHKRERVDISTAELVKILFAAFHERRKRKNGFVAVSYHRH